MGRIKKGDFENPMKEETLSEIREPFAVIDTADKNKVVATASSEKEANSSITTAELPPMRIKDKNTLKVVKTRKKQDVGFPLKEATTKELKDLDRGDDVMVNSKMGMFYGMKGSKVTVRFPDGQKDVPAKDVEIPNLMKESYYDYPDYGPVGASEMAQTQLHFIKYAADDITRCLKMGCPMPEWYQNKLAKMEGDMEGLYSYMKGKTRKMKSHQSDRYSMGMSMYGEETLTEQSKSNNDDGYDEFFQAALKKFGVKGIGELDKEKKKEFFNYVDKNWKADKEEEINEVLKPSDDVSTWIEDFYKSDAPQFKGKDKEERREMAVAAWLEARREAGYDVDPNPNKD